MWRVAFLVSAVAFIAVAASAGAQMSSASEGLPAGRQSAPVALTIDQAVAIAEHNNPDFQSTRNNARNAAGALRAAQGALLPQLSSSISAQYQQGGQQFFSGVALSANSDVMQSQYFVGLTYQVNAGTLIAPRVQRANSAAVQADIAGAGESLAAAVRQAYLSALQSRALATLDDSLVANARVQLELARARAAVGTGTRVDVQRAEVALGQQQVALLQARSQHEVDKLRLFQQMGVPEPADVTLTTVPTLADSASLPALPQLLAMARRQNPGVVASRAREHLAQLNVDRERTEYTPTLSLATGIGGYTYQYRDPNFLVNQARLQTNQARASCISTQEVRQAVGLPNTLAQCSGLVFTDLEAAQIRSSNARFPFGFTNAPRSVTASVSLPIFDGFAREQRVEEAEVARENAQYTIRSRELQLTADVTAAYLALQTALRTAEMQRANSAKARLQLQFVQDQYAVGLSTFLDLTSSRAAYAQAENDRITAVYSYHKARAALESAVGRPLH